MKSVSKLLLFSFATFLVVSCSSQKSICKTNAKPSNVWYGGKTNKIYK